MFLNGKQNQGTSSTPSVAVPDSVTTNDEVILVGHVNSSVTDPTALGPTNFVFLGYVHGFGENLSVYYKRLIGADTGSYVMGNWGASFLFNLFAFAFRGRDTTNPPVLGINNDAGSYSSPKTVNTNNVTALLHDDLLMIGALCQNASQATIAWTWPGGFTQDQEKSTSSWLPMGSAVAQDVAAGAGAGLSYTATWTGGTVRPASALIRLPSAAGGGNPSVTLSGTLATAGRRLRTSPDLVAGDIVEYQIYSGSGTLVVNVDASFVASAGVTSFQYRVNDGSGFGSWVINEVAPAVVRPATRLILPHQVIAGSGTVT